jgi:hypothetical protein
VIKSSSLKSFIARHGIEALGKTNAKRLVESAAEKGSGSLLAWPVEALARKALSKKTYGKISGAINKGIYDVDTILGKPLDYAASKLNLTKNLFKQEELIPKGKNTLKKIHRTSLTAPLGEVGKLVVPAAATSYAYEKLHPEVKTEGTV